ncbi:Uncharacterised protein [Klebsiella pneumoniae]|nr:Uncharacterised protein [Klebsiella pneumoniae]
MADVNGLRAVVYRARSVDATHIAPLVNRLDVQFHRRLLANLHPQRHTVGIAAFQRTVDFTETGLAFQLRAQRIQRRPIRHAPGHATQSVARLKGWREIGGIGRVKFDPRAAEGGKHAAAGVAGQAKIAHKFGAVVQVVYAKFQLFNSGNTHYSSPLYRSVARIWA